MSLPLWQRLVVLKVIVLHAAILLLHLLSSFLLLHADWLCFHSACGSAPCVCVHNSLTAQGNSCPGAWLDLQRGFCRHKYRRVSKFSTSADTERAVYYVVEAAARTLGTGANLTTGLLSSFTGAIWVHIFSSLSCAGGCASACSEEAGSACGSPAPSLCMPCLALILHLSNESILHFKVSRRSPWKASCMTAPDQEHCAAVYLWTDAHAK